MRSLSVTVETLEGAGVRLAVDDEGKLRMQVPNAIREEVAPLLDEVRAHRDDVVGLIRGRAPGPCVVCSQPASNLFCFSCWVARPSRRRAASPDVHRVLEALSPDGPGYIVIRSKTLDGALVVWVRDDSTDLPEEIRTLPRYGWAELGALVSARPADLVDLHRIKAALDGTVASRQPEVETEPPPLVAS